MESPFGTRANSIDLRAYHHQFTLSLGLELTDFYPQDWWGAPPPGSQASEARERGSTENDSKARASQPACVSSPGVHESRADGRGNDSRSRESFVQDVEQNSNAQVDAPPRVMRTASSAQCAATRPQGDMERAGAARFREGMGQQVRDRRTGQDDEPVSRARPRSSGSSSVSRPRSKRRPPAEARRSSFSMGAALARISRKGAGEPPRGMGAVV
jgi:hypothetical protein